MNERDQYPNLQPDVTIHHCTEEQPMPLEIADRLIELKQLWLHDGAEEIDEDFTGRFVTYKCEFCTHIFTVDLGD